MLTPEVAQQVHAILTAHVHRTFPGIPDHDDLVQDAMEVAVRVTPQYDPGRGIPLQGFLVMRGKYAIKERLRRLYGRNGARTGHLNMEAATDPHDPTWAAVDPTDPYEVVEQRAVIRQVIPHLNGKDREYLALIGQGRTNREVCAVLGITEGGGTHRVYQIRRRLAAA